MKPIEILNYIAERIYNLRGETFDKYVDPEEWEENKYKIINGKLTVISKMEYLKDCIGYFLLNVLATKNDNPIQGYHEARELIKTKNGFGIVDDIIFNHKTQNKGTIIHRIRISDKGISQDERNEIVYWRSLGDYVIVSSMDEFYRWYVSKFGEVEINF